MKKLAYIGIDTSNYTTSAALVDGEGEVLLNLKAPLSVAEGQRGLRQSDAVFAHVKNLPALMDTLRPALRDLEPCGICVSATPRDLEGSYMPCFLSGLSVAHALGAALDLPVFTCSHQAGHLMAALFASGATSLFGRTFGAFHVSGGTTDMLLVDAKMNGEVMVREVGGSADLHAGQVIDRIGVFLGLGFPAGPALEALALQNDKPLPTPKISVKGGTCNLSGLENLAKKLYENTGDAPLVAAFVLSFLEKTLFKMASYLRREDPTLPLLFAGGVMSNGIIKNGLRAKLGGEIYFAPPAFSADNAMGVAQIGRLKSQAYVSTLE